MHAFTVQRRAFSRRELAFLVGVPAAWGILLLFHPTGDADGFYEVIEGNVTAWLTVHIGMGIFVPLSPVWSMCSCKGWTARRPPSAGSGWRCSRFCTPRGSSCSGLGPGFSP
jgi:hypothetical protein